MPEQGQTDLSERIIEFIRGEIQDKTIEITRDTPIESIQMDSIDVIEVLFKFEEEFDATVNLAPDSRFATVGEFVDAVIAQVPPKKAARVASKHKKKA